MIKPVKAIVVCLVVVILLWAAVGCSDRPSSTVAVASEPAINGQSKAPDLRQASQLAKIQEIVTATANLKTTLRDINERKPTTGDHDRALALTDITVRHAESLDKDMAWDGIWGIYQNYLGVLTETRLQSNRALTAEQAKAAEAFKGQLEDVPLVVAGPAEPNVASKTVR